jgi:hypothetical protein
MDLTSPTSCLATVVPSVSPTRMPTLHRCDDGSHGCDPTSTQCVFHPGEAHLYTCECKKGYAMDLTSPTSCLATVVPTALPSISPTKCPSAAPTAESVTTAVPTEASNMAVLIVGMLLVYAGFLICSRLFLS